MDNWIESTLFVIVLMSLFPMLGPILAFFVCFYIGFKLVCKDVDIETAVRNWLVKKIMKVVKIEESESSSASE